MSYQIELRHMRYFLAVADHLHFRKAAESLYISQPGLSRQIREMEEGLGVRLFERHNRKVTLTNAGSYLLREFKGYFTQLERSIEHAKLLNDGLQGSLRFGYVGSAMQQIIPDLLLAFRKEHPQVLFSLKEMDNQHQIDGLLANDIDIGFVRQERIPKALQSLPVLKETFCLVLPKDHAVNTGNFTSMSQLKEESFIMFDPTYSPSYYEKIMQIFDDSGFTPNITHSTIHSGSIYKLIENNLGVSIVPRSLRQDHLPGVKFIELKSISQRTVLSVIWNPNSRNPILGGVISKIKGSLVTETV
ncbi:LysR family transcriptional regulator [Fulvivirga sp. M361]|uniref:LysR family transcriptional regulator n=1 Tax=Fulvivirga sp. M361 TaxID=2594266 RepID=UPI00117AF75B|nr:LysR family transcriptional regulator [Fulvivirga sp. M361]TRX54790.1 LysR family transcriptional regulator [Fulvivirga sp. M361]